VIVVGVDPGRTIGLAWVDLSSPERHVWAGQQTSPIKAFEWMREWERLAQIILIEDYVGGGVQSSDGLYTAKLAGFLYWAGELHALPVQYRVPQKRLAGLMQAKAHGYPVHATDALAHCYAHIRREHL
jgi:hypothetical protein